MRSKILPKNHPIPHRFKQREKAIAFSQESDDRTVGLINT
jgi:hypothetical protein